MTWNPTWQYLDTVLLLVLNNDTMVNGNKDICILEQEGKKFRQNPPV